MAFLIGIRNAEVSNVPYKSVKQERYFNVNRKKMESQGVDVDEWNAASKGKKIPMKVKTKKPKGKGHK